MNLSGQNDQHNLKLLKNLDNIKDLKNKLEI